MEMRKLKSRTPLPAPRSLLPLTLMAMLNCAEPTPPPAFELSGVIEGFYGPPWSHNDRLDMLRFMGRAGLKVYIYAPKNDPYHRTRWRDPYPVDGERQLRELVQTADAAGVEFWYSIHPGLTITYSDSLNYQDLLRKIDQVATLGVEHFGLFVDDVPIELAHAADRAAYRTLAAAHVDLTNRLYTYLAERGHTLALTPTIYTNAWGDLDYLVEIGAGVAPEVMILWTGPDVTSPIITKDMAFDWGALLQRKPLLWDNYPVNDYARWRLFLGPITGRAPDLAETTLGIIANPMNEAHASMISLATLGEYARDPAAYDPDRSLGAALDTLYGADVEAVLPFVDVFGDYGWDNNVFEPLYILADTIPVSAMERVLAQLRSALSELRRRADSSTALLSLHDEIAPFISQTSDRIAALRRTGFYNERDGALIYRRELDRVSTQHTTPVRIDGDLTEWQNADWRQLHRNGGVSGDHRVAFRRDDEFLHLAVEVRNRNIRAQAGRRVGQADHIAIVIDTDPSDGLIGSDDLFILLPPPHATADTNPTVISLPFQGHMAKWLADNRALTFTEFHLSTFATEPSPAAAPFAAGLRYASNRTRTGYTAVLAIPHLGRDRLHMSLTVTTTSGGKRVSSLSRRNYPANPTTFAEIRLND